MKMLVLGVNGQDGTLLAEHLLAEGHEVHGISRHQGFRHLSEETQATHWKVDLVDRVALARALEEIRPTVVFHLAAVHSSAVTNSYEERFESLVDVNTTSVHTVLEYARRLNKECRVVYAAGGKCFGTPYPQVVSESTPRRSDCLYSISKNAAVDLIRFYRTRHGIPGSAAYLFNHESHLRSGDFFIPTLLRALNTATERSERSTLYSLDFWCDWGDAAEFMSLLADLPLRAPGQDLVLGTGRCITGRNLARTLFEAVGLDYREYVGVAHEYSTTEGHYQVVLDRCMDLLGRVPERRIEAVCRDMYERAFS